MGHERRLSRLALRTFHFGATVFDPPGLPPEAQDRFETALEEQGATHLRVESDDEGRTTVSFRLDAKSEHEAMVAGSEITLSVLAGFSNVRWVSSGVSYWRDG